jgi:hypothetical protein
MKLDFPLLKVSPFNMSRKHRNHKLEEQIANLKIGSELNLECQELKDQNMEIVAKQALQNNKVKKIGFTSKISDDETGFYYFLLLNPGLVGSYNRN